MRLTSYQAHTAAMGHQHAAFSRGGPVSRPVPDDIRPALAAALAPLEGLLRELLTALRAEWAHAQQWRDTLEARLAASHAAVLALPSPPSIEGPLAAWRADLAGDVQRLADAVAATPGPIMDALQAQDAVLTALRDEQAAIREAVTQAERAHAAQQETARLERDDAVTGLRHGLDQVHAELAAVRADLAAAQRDLLGLRDVDANRWQRTFETWTATLSRLQEEGHAAFAEERQTLRAERGNLPATLEAAQAALLTAVGAELDRRLPLQVAPPPPLTLRTRLRQWWTRR